MKNNGKEFEALTGLIENTLRGNNCEILLNHVMINKYNIEREIDVYIRAPNGNIAIECKDWRGKKRNIEMQLIDAFHGKTSEIEDIDKKIYVVRGGYQSGAKKLAKGLGIELFKLDEINDQQVLGWIQFEAIKKLHVSSLISHIGILVSNKENKLTYLSKISNETLLEVEGEGEFTFHHILSTNLEAYREEVENFSLECVKINEHSFWKEHLFPTNDKAIWYRDENKKHRVLMLRCIRHYEIILSSAQNTNLMSYDNITMGHGVASIANITFEESLEKLIFVKDDSTNEETAYIQEIKNGKTDYIQLFDRIYENNK